MQSRRSIACGHGLGSRSIPEQRPQPTTPILTEKEYISNSTLPANKFLPGPQLLPCISYAELIAKNHIALYLKTTETMFSEQYNTSNSILGYLNTVVTLGGVLWAVWTAAWHLNFNRTTKHLGSVCQDKDAMEFFVAKIPSQWRRIVPFGISKVPIPRVPSIYALLAAGDDGVFTSSMFNSIPTNQDSISWKPFYETFFLEYAWALQGSRCRGLPVLRDKESDPHGYLLSFQKKAQEVVWKKIQNRHPKAIQTGSFLFDL